MKFISGQSSYKAHKGEDSVVRGAAVTTACGLTFKRARIFDRSMVELRPYGHPSQNLPMSATVGCCTGCFTAEEIELIRTGHADQLGWTSSEHSARI